MKLSKKSFKLLFIILLIIIIIPFSIMLKNKLNNDTIYSSNTSVDIKGTVKSINTINNISTILVEDETKTSKFDNALVTINDNTKITKNNSNQNYKINDIKIGDKVEIEFTGTVAESYPVQSIAKTISVH